MKVNQTGTVRTDATRKADKAKGRGAEFARHLGESEEADDTRGVSGVRQADSLLAAQEVDERPERRARRHGEDLLSRLDEIRHGLLMGSIPEGRLHQLAQMVDRQREAIMDPGLIEILDEIDLRVKVELAKLGMAG